MDQLNDTTWKDPYIRDGFGFMPVHTNKNPSFDLSGYQTDLNEMGSNSASPERRSRQGLHTPPPNSNTGGKVTEPNTGYEVCVDWLRMSGPRSMRHRACDLLAKYLGTATYGKGRYLLNTGYRWGNGGIYFDADAGGQVRDHCVVDVTGELVQEMTMNDVVHVMDELFKIGFKMCRLDIAVDLFDRPQLIDQVTQSCHDGELCRAKRYEPKFISSGKQLTGHGCNVGVRGKDGSGRYLRVYDKSLQTKTGQAGDWVRWEAELSDECAQQAAMAIIQSENFQTDSVSIAFGVCDFRKETGARHIERRPRVEWFEKLIGTLSPRRTVKSRSKSTLHSFKKWMQTSVLPKLSTLSVASGYRMDELVFQLFGGFEPDPQHIEDHKVRSLLLELGGSPGEAHKQFDNKRIVMRTARGSQ